MRESADVDALFQLSPGEFTAARNALASRLRKEGRSAEAERVKALAKPTATAWAVNQLYWRERKAVDRLFAVGRKVRDAQTGKRANLRSLLDERRKIVSELTDLAAEFLGQGGHAATQDARRRISITLDTLAAAGPSGEASQAGRLSADLEPLGFDSLAALMGGQELAPAKVLQFRRAEQAKKSDEDAAAARKQAMEAVRGAEKALAEARRESERTAAAAAKAETRAAALAEQKRILDVRCEEAREESRAAAREAERAAKMLAEAERALARARERLA